MNKERILNIARALRESPSPERFDMDDFIHQCGTPACALGHYACRPDLQAEFFPRRNASGGFFGVANEELRPIAYSGADIQHHFDISEHQAYQLFAPRADARSELDDCCHEEDEIDYLALSADNALEAADWIESWVAKHAGA